MTAEEKIVDRITKLLRMARDLGDEPQGKTSLKIAKMLMAKHGVRVELEEEYESEAKSAKLAEGDKAVAWEEWLAEGLATIYRCGMVPQRFGTRWQVWIYADEPERVSSCRDHYEFIEEQIRNRISIMEIRLKRAGYPRDDVPMFVDSLAMGLVQGAVKNLLFMLGYEGPTPFEMGFDYETFMKAATVDPLAVDYPETDETALVRYVHRVGAEIPEYLRHGVSDPNKLHNPDPAWFQKGIRDADFLHLVPSRLKDAFTGTPGRTRHGRT